MEKSSSRTGKKSTLQSLIAGPEKNEQETDPSDKFEMKPDISKRFKSTKAKEIIGKVLHDNLHDIKYSEDSAQVLTKTIAHAVRTRLEGEMYERYKLVVNVVLGERKGEGVKICGRCLWDPETDTYATDNFQNETLFCAVTVYGILFY